MTAPSLVFPVPNDTSYTAQLRGVVHDLSTLACIALLAFGSELALKLLPDSPERDQGMRGLNLVAQLAAGCSVDPDDIATAMHDENDEGVMLVHQAASPGLEADVWATVVGVMGYAAYSAYIRAGEQPDGLVEGWKSPDALDFCVDPFISLDDLDWDAMVQAETYAVQNSVKAPDGWGNPMRVEDLRRAAFPTSGMVAAGVGV